MARHRSLPPWEFPPRRYKIPGSYDATLRYGHYSEPLVRHPLSPYWEKCGAMGCGILYMMAAELIGLSATLATRRTKYHSMCEAVESVHTAVETQRGVFC
jgi:hypothetical protein